MPDGFVRLADVDPTIRQDMRYAGPRNFTGRPVAGYRRPVCILTRRAAEALARVQAELAPRGLSLKVYDCYRPAAAVADFLRWSREPDLSTKAEYYPREDKGRLFARGYIATRSGHSRGSTVDLTIVPRDPTPQAGTPGGPCTAPPPARAPDDGLDMGTAFDCFDDRAATAAPVPAGPRANRLLLFDAMRRGGFANYAREWWHYGLLDEPYPDRTFDFPVE
ncbi:M15 family metallopeptidase [Prosthecomicrobium sp. N25]